jgi:NTE family protein
VKLQTEQGTAFFGDGCVRLQQPLSPVIRLGARKILAIGVRGENLEHQTETAAGQRNPSLAQVLGVLLNVMFHLAADVEHLERLNELIRKGRISQSGVDGPERMRSLTALIITPSVTCQNLRSNIRKTCRICSRIL